MNDGVVVAREILNGVVRVAPNIEAIGYVAPMHV